MGLGCYTMSVEEAVIKGGSNGKNFWSKSRKSKDINCLNGIVQRTMTTRMKGFLKVRERSGGQFKRC